MPNVNVDTRGMVHTLILMLFLCSLLIILPRATFPMTQVFVDEELVFSSPVPYPRHITEPLTQCSIGTEFDGQMSGVLLFSAAADLKVVGSMLNGLAGRTGVLGREATRYKDAAADPDLWADPATVSVQERLKRKLLGSKCRIFAALLPGRTINGQCLEPHNGHHARLRAGTTHVWITSSAQDVIRSIGGAPALITMARHLLSHSPGSSISTSGPNSFSGHNVDTVISVLLSFLDGSVTNQVCRLTFGDDADGIRGVVAIFTNCTVTTTPTLIYVYTFSAKLSPKCFRCTRECTCAASVTFSPPGAWRSWN